MYPVAVSFLRAQLLPRALPLTFLSKLTDKLRRTTSQLGVVRIFPSGCVAFQETQKFPPSYGFAGSFDQEGAAPPWPNDRIDFLNQIMGEQNMRAFAFHEHPLHMCLISVS